MKNLLALLIVLPLTCFAGQTLLADDGKAVYELRTYTTHPGRLPALHKRFRDHTMRIFKKHGMTNVMYWTPIDQENTLSYVLKHDSREAAKKSWEGFRKDEEWQKVFKESHKDGKIVMKVESVFMKATDYSPAPSKKSD